MKAKDQKVSTLSIVPPVFDTYQPNAHLIHQKVAEAIDAAEGKAPKKTSDTVVDSSGSGGAATGKAGRQAGQGSEDPGGGDGGSIGSLHDGYAANESQDLDSAC